MTNWRAGRTVLLLGALVLFFLSFGFMPTLLPEGLVRNLIFPILVLCALFLTVVSVRFSSGWPTLLIWVAAYIASFWMLVADISATSINFVKLLTDMDNALSLVTSVSLIHLLLTMFLMLSRRTDDAIVYAFVIFFALLFLLLALDNRMLLRYPCCGDPRRWRYQRIQSFSVTLVITTLLAIIFALIAELTKLLRREVQAREALEKQKDANP